MRRAFIGISLTVLLVSLVFSVFGCGYVTRADDIVEQKAANVMRAGPDRQATAQMGETTAEGHRRHVRNHRLNRRGMMEDIDALFLMDRPSRLTERAIP